MVLSTWKLFGCCAERRRSGELNVEFYERDQGVRVIDGVQVSIVSFVSEKANEDAV